MAIVPALSIRPGFWGKQTDAFRRLASGSSLPSRRISRTPTRNGNFPTGTSSCTLWAGDSSWSNSRAKSEYHQVGVFPDRSARAVSLRSRHSDTFSEWGDDLSWQWIGVNILIVRA
jgi:hypothetical protein